MIQYKKICEDLRKLWFTSDLHGFHTNLTLGVTSWEGDSKKGCRNFETVSEMNAAIIEGINKHVQKDDVLVHCGDWSFAGRDKIELLRSLINCKTIYGIQGNHDHEKNNDLYNKIFVEYVQLGYYSCQGIEFFCSHYPNHVWHKSHHGVIGIYGHCHGSHAHEGKAIDVGIDNAYKLFGEYRPFSALEILRIMENKEILINSHHGLQTS